MNYKKLLLIAFQVTVHASQVEQVSSTFWEFQIALSMRNYPTNRLLYPEFKEFFNHPSWSLSHKKMWIKKVKEFDRLIKDDNDQNPNLQARDKAVEGVREEIKQFLSSKKLKRVRSYTCLQGKADLLSPCSD